MTSWEKVCGVCTHNDAPIVLECRSRFQCLVLHELSKNHWNSLYDSLANISKEDKEDTARRVTGSNERCLSSLYFVKVSTLHSRLFSQLCNDLDTLNKALFHTKVTRRNVLKCVLELCDERKMFVNRKQDLILEHCPVMKVNCQKQLT